MICLPSTQTLQVVLGSSETAQYTATWAIKSTGAVAQSNGTLGSSDTNVVTAPSSGDYHLVKQLTIYNDDTTSITATIKLDASGTETILCKMSIPIGSTLFYSPESGFHILQPSTIGASFGAERSDALTVTSSFSEVVYNLDQFNTHGWYSISTGRFTPQRAGTYRFSAHILVTQNGWWNLVLRKNGGTAESISAQIPSKQYDVCGLFRLNGTTDYVSVWAGSENSTTILSGYARWNYFFGEWVGD